jgi:hypothetical protein
MQPASASAPSAAESGRGPTLKCRRVRQTTTTMWLILLEAGIALALLIFIVWWTMFDKPKRKPPKE